MHHETKNHIAWRCTVLDIHAKTTVTNSRGTILHYKEMSYTLHAVKNKTVNNTGFCNEYLNFLVTWSTVDMALNQSGSQVLMASSGLACVRTYQPYCERTLQDYHSLSRIHVLSQNTQNSKENIVKI